MSRADYTTHTHTTALKALRGWLRTKGTTAEEHDGAVEHTITKAEARDILSDIGPLDYYDDDHGLFFFEDRSAWFMDGVMVFSAAYDLTFAILYSTDGERTWKTWTTADSRGLADIEKKDAYGFLPQGVEIKVIEVWA